MNDFFKKKLNPADRSLELNDILEEEFRHIHGDDAHESNAPITFINSGQLIERLHHELQQLTADTTGKVSGSGVADKNNYYVNPYIPLAKWIREAMNGQALDEDLIRQVLNDKINFTGKSKKESLLSQEPWLQDAPRRSYVRGCLKQYQEQNSFASLGIDERTLNRLMLEDAFADHIQPRDSRASEGIISKMRRKNQIALCLSGGGIRSATFALGIIQGLANHNVLDRFTYLSTVSGGGYLGGWLSAWIHHDGFGQVIDRIKTRSNIPFKTEADPILHLRKYTNYLSPKVGLFSTDTWTLVATFIRNLLLIWLAILPFLAIVALIPWIAVNIASTRIDPSLISWYWLMGLCLMMAAALLILSIRFLHAYVTEAEISRTSGPNLEKKSQAETSRKEERNAISSKPNASRDQKAFINQCLLPLSFAVLLLLVCWGWFEQVDNRAPDWIYHLHAGLGLGARSGLKVFSPGGYWVMGTIGSIHLVGWILAKPTDKAWYLLLLQGLVIFLSGVVAGLLMLLIVKLMRSDFGDDSALLLYTWLSFPSFLLAIMMGGYILEGMLSLYTDDSRREWTARHSGWLLIVSIVWLVLMGLILFGPRLFHTLQIQLASLGLGSGTVTALLGSSSKSAGEGQAAGSRQGKGPAGNLIGIFSEFALPILGFLTFCIVMILLSMLNLNLIRVLSIQLHELPSYLTRLSQRRFEEIPLYVPLLLLAGLLAMGLFLARLIDTNRFSLHAMYRARLIRAYLGASRSQTVRRPDPFTGFDENDNLPMGELDNTHTRPHGSEKAKNPPFHLFNLTLNLVGGQNLAWQERKAETFTVSTLHAGSINVGYRRTRKGSNSESLLYGGPKGITLGTAMTISGAAASPNSGYHSSPLIAFLMTLFNVRLGWWLGNPGPAGDHTFYQNAPLLAIKPIWDEMFGKTDDLNDYVYLSDGGHFDNLGLYEMVLRRNRLIIVSDAGCDEKCTLEDLGNAIRKIRIDLGVPIEFSENFKIRARSADLSLPGEYWALGRIRYSAVDPPEGDSPDEMDGVLLYLKPAFYGKEPRDIFNYASSKPQFPHESTADQFFSESQFESYRALGQHIVETLHQTFPGKADISLAELFEKTGPEKVLRTLNKPGKPPQTPPPLPE